MGLQSLCCAFHSPKIAPVFCRETVSTTAIDGGSRKIRLTNAAKSYPVFNSRWFAKESLLPSMKLVSRVYALGSDSDAKSEVSSESYIGAPDSDAKLQVSSEKYTGVFDRKFDEVEPFGGKSGSVSFYGVTYQVVEESKLVSTPYEDGGGSVLWVLAPLVLILSFILPPIFISNAVDSVFKNEYLAEIVGSLACEAVFYVGIALFLLITDRVQRPYLQFTAKRWGLITGLKGHLTTSFFTMGLKVVVPLAITYVTWPIIGMQAMVAVTPLLVGFLAQFTLESFIDKQGSSCWPLVPIIFEVYRFYQLTKAVNLVESLMFAMRGAQATPEVIERSGALVAMFVTFQVVGVVGLWSLLTFLLRLFPSRPVAEKY